MPDVLRVFVSSPGDVGEERVIVERVLNALAGRFADRARIEPVFWEHEPLLATGTFQTQIIPPSQTDIVICILWNRLGTRLPENIQRDDGSTYASGTEFEFEDAVSAFRQRGTPDLIVYRKSARAVVSLDDPRKVKSQLEQKEALDAFVQNWFHGDDGTLVAAFHQFTDTAKFEELLETHLRKLIEKRLDLEEAGSAPLWDSGSPFRGLEVFDREHAAVFFGRTRAVSEVLAALRRQDAVGRPFLLLLGASGSGKSSLARAGVLPLLTRPGVIEGVAWWRWAVMRPTDSPDGIMHSMAAALLATEALPELASDGTSADQLGRMLQESPAGAWMLVKGALSQIAAAAQKEASPEHPAQVRLVLLIDQLEEVFTTQGVNQQQRGDFFRAITALVESGRVWVIATLRSDFYHRCAEVPELVHLKQSHDGQNSAQYDVAPPAATEIGDIIRRPASVAGLRYEVDEQSGSRLDDVLRDDAVAEPDSLPLLEFALDELYKQRSEENVLTHEAYRRLRGVAGALATRADEVVSRLPQQHRDSLPALFRLLVNVGGETDRPTRRIAPLDQVRSTPETAELTDELVKARLLVVDQDTIRITHEKLLERWQLLQDWVETDRRLLLARTRVVSAARRWDKGGRSPDLLLAPGKPLQEASELLREETAVGLDTTQREFVQLSQRRQARRVGLRWALGLVTSALIIVASIALVSSRSSAEAKRIAQVRASLANLDLRDDANRETLDDTTTTRVHDVYDQETGRLRRRAALELIYRGQFDAEQVKAVLGEPNYFWDDGLDLANFQLALQAWQAEHRNFPFADISISDKPAPPNQIEAMRLSVQRALRASILISQGQAGHLTNVCKPSADLEHPVNPQARVALERDLGNWLGDKNLFIEQFQRDEMTPFVQAMICRSLYFVKPEIAFDGPQTTALTNRLAELLDSDHASVRASAFCTLKKWRSPLALKSGKEKGRNWYELPIEGDIRLTMVGIPTGKLVRFDKPANRSTKNVIPVTRRFWLASTETTIGVYRVFLRENPSFDPSFNPSSESPDDIVGDLFGDGFGAESAAEPAPEPPRSAMELEDPSLPAHSVSWLDAIAFCNWLSERSGKPLCYHKLIDGERQFSPSADPTSVWESAMWQCDFTADGFRLPTEVEWEYACRAGSTCAFSFGDSEQLADDYAWTNRNSPQTSQHVAELLPNAWGLFDIHGNVREWCWDPYDLYPDQSQIADNYVTSFDSDVKQRRDGLTVRGGAFLYPVAEASCSDRMPYAIDVRDKDLGFRIAQTLTEEEP